MSSSGPDYVEASGPLGMALVAMGVSIVAAHAAIGVFAGWSWAVLLGGLWVVLGTLLLFPDVRLYQNEEAPLERLLLESDEL